MHLANTPVVSPESKNPAMAGLSLQIAAGPDTTTVPGYVMCLETEILEHLITAHIVGWRTVHRLHLLDQPQAGTNRPSDAETDAAGAGFAGTTAVGLATSVTVALLCPCETIFAELAILTLGTVSL